MGKEKDDAPKEPPKWAKRYTRKVKRLLGLHGFDLDFVYTELEVGDHGQLAGHADPILPYLRGEIEFHYPHVKEENTEAKLTVIHELLHFALTRTKHVVCRYAEHGMRKREGQVLIELYTLAEEEEITRLSRMLLPMIDAMPDEDEDAE